MGVSTLRGNNLKELSRTPWETGTNYTYSCLVCGKTVTLLYNGGELDYQRCCGHVYVLEAPQTDFVVYKADENEKEG